MDETLRDRIPLQKRKIVKKSIGAILAILIVFGFASFFVVGMLYGSMDGAPAGGFTAFVRDHRAIIVTVWAILIGLQLCSCPFYQYLYFRSYFYDADKENVIIRKGVLAKKEITLPFSRITDVYVDQDLLDALLRLYDVHVSTPTQTSGEFAHIDGVDKNGSVQLRALVLEQVNRATGSPKSE